jgi:hypothetical protein
MLTCPHLVFDCLLFNINEFFPKYEKFFAFEATLTKPNDIIDVSLAGYYRDHSTEKFDVYYP